jgi:pentatricopeptide repeat-containing protein PET309
LGLRRRKRSLVGFPRNYASDALSNAQSTHPDTSKIQEIILQGGTDHSVASQALEELSRILEVKPRDFDKAWVLYLAAGKPSVVRSALCQYLARSPQVSDSDRAWQIFEEIPLEDRLPSDFECISRSQTRMENHSRLIEIAKQAGLSTTQEVANSCFPWLFAYFFKRGEWAPAVEVSRIWRTLEPSTDIQKFRLLFSRLQYVTLVRSCLYFGKHLQKSRKIKDYRYHIQKADQDFFDLAEALLHDISHSPFHPEHASMDRMLKMLSVYRRIKIPTLKHYSKIIETLQSARTRSGFSRSIVFYRQLRFEAPQLRPSYDLLYGQLVSMKAWGMTSGISYFLDEIRHFHRRPSMAAYLVSMDCYAHSGDFSQTESVFNRMVADHGKPSDCRPVLPLLVAQATTGNVEGTRRQFERLTDEFNLQPNIHCWNELIRAHAPINDWTGAQKTFTQMLHTGLHPDSYTFGILMGITAKRGDADATRQLLKEAHQHEVLITMPMLDTIIQVYCWNGQLDFAEQLADACSSLQIKGTTTRIWNRILLQYARRLDVKTCERIERRMETAGIEKDAWSYYATMLGLVLAGRTDRARRMLQSLHKRRVIYAEEAHYALILSGYVKDRNRDMVSIIFKEIVERFGKAGPKSSLLYLQSQVQRDLQIAKETGIKDSANYHLVHAEKALANYLARSHAVPLTSGPGDLPTTATESAPQYEYLIKQYGKRGTIDRALALYQEFMDRRAPANPRDEPEPIPIGVLTSMMSAHLKVAQYDEVEKLWNLAVSGAMDQASVIEIDFFPDSSSSKTEGPHTTSSRPFDLSTLKTSTRQHSRKIIPAQRFILAKPLGLYMRVLGYQNQTSRISEVVANLEKLGFALTTFNWSSWIQMLASSDHYPDQVKAFRMFEEKFAPRFPGWYKLLRGFGHKSPQMKRTTWMLEDHRTQSFRDVTGKNTRRHWISVEPDHLQPTYLTIVFLAASIDRIRDRIITQGSHDLQKISAVAPKTVKLIGEMPYKRDNVQGVLLRHRSEQPSKEKNPTEPFVVRGGVLGKVQRARPRPDIFRDDETMDTWQRKTPNYLLRKHGESSDIETPDDDYVSNDRGVQTQLDPLSRADQIDVENHIRNSRIKLKQKEQRKSRFASVVSREKQRREISKKHLEDPVNPNLDNKVFEEEDEAFDEGDQTPTDQDWVDQNFLAFIEEHASANKEQVEAELHEEAEQQGHSEVERSEEKEQSESGSEAEGAEQATKDPSEVPNEDKTRE